MNTIIKIENGKIYTKSDLNDRNDIFEIVEKIPKNYFVWNIGENMGTDEYIPICEYINDGKLIKGRAWSVDIKSLNISFKNGSMHPQGLNAVISYNLANISSIIIFSLKRHLLIRHRRNSHKWRSLFR